jgi:hypothetical protein
MIRDNSKHFLVAGIIAVVTENRDIILNAVIK